MGSFPETYNDLGSFERSYFSFRSHFVHNMFDLPLVIIFNN